MYRPAKRKDKAGKCVPPDVSQPTPHTLQSPNPEPAGPTHLSFDSV